MPDDQKNILTLAKNGERYVFTYDLASSKALLGVFGRYAANPELIFSWHDAAVLSKKMREKDKHRPLSTQPGFFLKPSPRRGG